MFYKIISVFLCACMLTGSVSGAAYANPTTTEQTVETEEEITDEKTEETVETGIVEESDSSETDTTEAMQETSVEESTEEPESITSEIQTSEEEATSEATATEETETIQETLTEEETFTEETVMEEITTEEVTTEEVATEEELLSVLENEVAENATASEEISLSLDESIETVVGNNNNPTWLKFTAPMSGYYNLSMKNSSFSSSILVIVYTSGNSGAVDSSVMVLNSGTNVRKYIEQGDTAYYRASVNEDNVTLTACMSYVDPVTAQKSEDGYFSGIYEEYVLKTLVTPTYETVGVNITLATSGEEELSGSYEVTCKLREKSSNETITLNQNNNYTASTELDSLQKNSSYTMDIILEDNAGNAICVLTGIEFSTKNTDKLAIWSISNVTHNSADILIEYAANYVMVYYGKNGVDEYNGIVTSGTQKLMLQPATEYRIWAQDVDGNIFYEETFTTEGMELNASYEVSEISATSATIMATVSDYTGNEEELVFRYNYTDANGRVQNSCEYGELEKNEETGKMECSATIPVENLLAENTYEVDLYVEESSGAWVKYASETLEITTAAADFNAEDVTFTANQNANVPTTMDYSVIIPQSTQNEKVSVYYRIPGENNSSWTYLSDGFISVGDTTYSRYASGFVEGQEYELRAVIDTQGIQKVVEFQLGEAVCQPIVTDDTDAFETTLTYALPVEDESNGDSWTVSLSYLIPGDSSYSKVVSGLDLTEENEYNVQLNTGSYIPNLTPETEYLFKWQLYKNGDLYHTKIQKVTTKKISATVEVLEVGPNKATCKITLSSRTENLYGSIYLDPVLRKKDGGISRSYSVVYFYPNGTKVGNTYFTLLEPDTEYEVDLVYGGHGTSGAVVCDTTTFKTPADDRVLTLKSATAYLNYVDFTLNLTGKVGGYLHIYAREKGQTDWSEHSWVEGLGAGKLTQGLYNLKENTTYEYVIGIGKSEYTIEASLMQKITGEITTSKDNSNLTKYSITYELDGGTNHPDNPMEYDKNDAYTLKPPTKEYHTFAGWYSDAKFTKKVTKIAKGSKGDKTFYAKWTPYTYSIVYNANGGTGKMNATTGKYNVDTTIAKNAFKRTGYTFVKWSTTKDGMGEDVTFYEQGQVVQNLSLVNKAKVQLYAIWEPVDYTIVLDKNSDEAVDGTIEAASNSFAAEYGETYVLTGEEYERIGYEIVSWNTKPNGKGKKIANGDIKNLTTVDGSTVTLYAQWAIDKYKITFDYGGGKVKKANPKTYTYNMTKDITFNIPVKKGYNFEGYYEVDPYSNNFTGNEKKVTGIVKGTTGDKTFYAKWKPVSYTIIFADKSGAGFGDGITEESIRQPMKYEDVLTFTDVYFQRPGYRLVSWTGKVNGKNKKYSVGRGYSNLTAKDGDEITLYADWKKNSYTITYKLDGGKNDAKNPKTYAVDSRDFTLKNPTKKGYNFEGWYITDENGNLAENPITVIAGELNQDLVLTAKWIPRVYCVEIYPNTNDYVAPEDLEIVTETYKYGEKFNPQDWSDKYQPTEVWKNSGYGILYWSTKANGTGTKYYPGKEYSNLTTGGNIKLYAKWGMKPYTINYDYGDVEAKGISNKNPVTFTYNKTAKITLKNISKTGYIFGGWYTASSFAEESKVTEISRSTCEPITLYAKLTPISYTIKLNPNGSNVIAKDGLVTEIKVDYNDSYVLEADAYTREHYEFDYWTTKSNGKGNKVALTGGVAPLTKTNGATVNLYPNWKLTSYNITYNNVTFENEKVTNSSPKAYSYNAKKDVTLKKAVRKGYVFGGWYEEDTTAQDFDVSTATKVTKIVKGSDGDKVLYALWTPIRYKIKLYANARDAESGTITINSAEEVMEVEYGEKVCLYSDFYKRAGYNLVGFNSKSNGKGTAYTVGHYDYIYATKANSTVKVYAIWEKVKPQNISGVELAATQDSVIVNFETSDISYVYRYEVALSEYFTMSDPTVVRVTEGTALLDGLESEKRYFVRVREIRLDSKGNEISGAWSSLESIKTE